MLISVSEAEKRIRLACRGCDVRTAQASSGGLWKLLISVWPAGSMLADGTADRRSGMGTFTIRMGALEEIEDSDVDATIVEIKRFVSEPQQ